MPNRKPQGQGPDDRPRGYQAGGGGDPRQIMQSAATILKVDPETLRAAVGPPPPDFARAAKALNLPEATIRAAFDQARGIQR